MPALSLQQIRQLDQAQSSFGGLFAIFDFNFFERSTDKVLSTEQIFNIELAGPKQDLPGYILSGVRAVMHCALKITRTNCLSGDQGITPSYLAVPGSSDEWTTLSYKDEISYAHPN
jgi:hypothetical protein